MVNGNKLSDDHSGRAGKVVASRLRLDYVAFRPLQRKFEVARVALLANLAVHATRDAHAFPWIDFVSHQGTDGAKCVEAFRTRPLIVFFLKIAGTDVVRRGVTEDVRKHIFVGRQFVTALGDHHAKLAFVINSLGEGWAANILP